MDKQIASLQPTWYQEWEKEQNDKLTILRKQTQHYRDVAFTESAYGTRTYKLMCQCRVDAYDVVLGLIDRIER